MRIRGERGSVRRSAHPRGTAVLALICALLAARPLASSAAEPADQPAVRPVAQGNHVYLESDTLTYDSDQRVVTATGHVAVSYGERTGVADTLIYNRDTGKVTAIGNVAITDSSGVVMFAERADLTTICAKARSVAWKPC
jgi:LPS-assembly protein